MIKAVLFHRHPTLGDRSGRLPRHDADAASTKVNSMSGESAHNKQPLGNEAERWPLPVAREASTFSIGRSPTKTPSPSQKLGATASIFSPKRTMRQMSNGASRVSAFIAQATKSAHSVAHVHATKSANSVRESFEEAGQSAEEAGQSAAQSFEEAGPFARGWNEAPSSKFSRISIGDADLGHARSPHSGLKTRSRGLIRPDSKHFLPVVPRPPLKGVHSYEHPYENLVLAGGGMKGLAYPGMVMELSALGILPHLKRFAGASAGSLVALFLALGLDGHQIIHEMNALNFQELVQDGPVPLAAIGKSLPAMLRSYRQVTTYLGLNPSQRLLDHIGKLCEKYTGRADITFRMLYETYGVELCARPQRHVPRLP